MATTMSAETLGVCQQSMRTISTHRNFTLNSSHENIRTRMNSSVSTAQIIMRKIEQDRGREGREVG
jgi:hypothetical protein